MDKKPVIGISGSVIVDDGGMFPGYERAYVNDDYIKAVTLAGGIPVMLPMVYEEEIIRKQLEAVDGLVMSGGHDVNPLLYGEEPSQKLGGILPKRDVFDCTLIKIAMEMKKPILGICRGHQIINVVNGGNLYQDLSFIDGCYIKHNQGSLSNVPTHTVKVEKNTKLNVILGDEVITNSFHHLAVKDVAPGFKAVAMAKDGVIEAIEKEGEHFVMGIQWHPEMMAKENEKMLGVFKKLVQESAK
ncbi:gamma-glutamyl-gamma-aminobutyrate hydrolase family protein [Clostridium sp. KNHs214]|uniref:gamma-glutamyl-gamma-aminobutyrate hydrolase family protein n=1 Tax=Clostridium sp. KNHs214 TaxID=1540257 RepID=UPI0005559644|nr:gamma-glutamyl-gamma-aminobutyrate hydrolase family protein [Clostridium sp. KNHs214]